MRGSGEQINTNRADNADKRDAKIDKNGQADKCTGGGWKKLDLTLAQKKHLISGSFCISGVELPSLYFSSPFSLFLAHSAPVIACNK